jgi:hypothetical protein
MLNNYWIKHCIALHNSDVGIEIKVKVPQMGDLGGRKGCNKKPG